MVKNLPANAGDITDMDSIPVLGRFPRGRHDNPLQHSCLENPMDREAWWALVHRVTKSQTQLKLLNSHTSSKPTSCCSVTKLCPTLQPHRLQQARLLCPSLSPGACSNSCPLSWCCPPTISSSVTPFSSCLQPFLASGSFQMSWLFTSDGQNIGVSPCSSNE